MAFTDQQQQVVLRAVQAKIGQGRVAACTVCGQANWGIQNQGLVLLTMQPSGQTGVVLGGPALPCVALVCNTCGNTALLNAFVLGVADAFGLKPAGTGEAQPVAPPAAATTPAEPAPAAETKP